MKGFTKYPANWADATRTLQALLVVSCMTAARAVGFTFHSCRYTYPTFACQRMMRPEAITPMGDWFRRGTVLPKGMTEPR